MSLPGKGRSVEGGPTDAWRHCLLPCLDPQRLSSVEAVGALRSPSLFMARACSVQRRCSGSDQASGLEGAQRWKQVHRHNTPAGCQQLGTPLSGTGT